MHPGVSMSIGCIIAEIVRLQVRLKMADMAVIVVWAVFLYRPPPHVACFYAGRIILTVHCVQLSVSCVLQLDSHVVGPRAGLSL